MFGAPTLWSPASILTFLQDCEIGPLCHVWSTHHSCFVFYCNDHDKTLKKFYRDLCLTLWNSGEAKYVWIFAAASFNIFHPRFSKLGSTGQCRSLKLTGVGWGMMTFYQIHKSKRKLSRESFTEKLFLKKLNNSPTCVLCILCIVHQITPIASAFWGCLTNL